MDPDKKLEVQRDNAKLGRGMVYMLFIGMGIALAISNLLLQWPVWGQVLATLFGGPILALVLYLPLSFLWKIVGFGAKSFVPPSKD